MNTPPLQKQMDRFNFMRDLKIQPPASIWRIYTKDTKVSDFYQFGPEFNSFESARGFAKGCLRKSVQRYAHVVRFDTSTGVPIPFSNL